ncbi:MAG TPA: dynamin family protein [Pseudonocardiaceae bacterium]|nr:dynamin family protein [Pseudonocardiaceae bacterium]
MIATPWLDALDQTIGACARHERLELADRLRRRRAQLVDPRLRVLVIGGPNQGKSQLVNALVNAPVCAVGDDLTTGTTTTIAHADTPSAVLVRAPADEQPDPTAIGAGPDRRPIPIDEVPEQVTRTAVAGTASAPAVTVEVGIPRKLLASGLVLIDTPAIGETDSTRAPAVSRALTTALRGADVVLLASDATAELSETELNLLSDVTKSCPNIIVALTKIDLSPWWRHIAERDRRKLADAGVPARLVPVSATLRLHAARTGDTALNAESGFPQLISMLRQDVTAKPDRLAPRSIAVLASTALAGLITSLHGELGDQSDSPRTASALARVDTASRRLDDLRHQAMLCQTALSDDIADLISDVEYDLRDRTRQILREIDRALEEADPLTCWDQLADWLAQRLAEAAEANFGWLMDRADWIVRKVTRALPASTGHPPVSAPEIIGALEGMLPPADPAESPNLEPFTIGQKAFTAMRGSYGGLLMFGLITSLAGMPLINGISLAAGATFGGKSIRDESDMRCKRRQAAARSAAQRQLDDFFLAFSKETRDAVRDLQRGLRDQITELSRHLVQRAAEDVNAAREAARAEAVQHDSAHREVRSALTQLITLHRRIETLAAASTASAASAASAPPVAAGATRPTPGLEITA